MRATKQWRGCELLRALCKPEVWYVRVLCSFINGRSTDLRLSVDLSVLPPNAPDLLSAPTATTPAFIAVSIAFTFLFFFLFTFTALRTKLGKMGPWFDKPVVQRSTAWIGLLGFMLGLTSFLVIRMWFGKAVEDFNATILKGGDSSPALVAATSNGFVSAYSFKVKVSFRILTKVLYSDLRGIRLLCSASGVFASETPCYCNESSINKCRVLFSLGHRHDELLCYSYIRIIDTGPLYKFCTHMHWF